MVTKHGLSQGRLNTAKDYTRSFLERINKIDLMYQLSVNKMVDGEKAENFIAGNIKGIERDWEWFKSYIKQRDDMRELD
ncbi:hypothetical protein [Bacillus pumilus]|uniref:hypothetical protein n=1 Tax=Bacillus pumilus TaxID=1408 RepID=UPI002282ED07|nr:hypothetical protein [Bacillus pumilus]MCY7500149.1 hypothetical protein [Bacillus pumilus]MCY7528527.1 hypothetical protein [Bacillus pumilus]MED4439515.1 hypothetical protein [Bacillus pumilus]MED4489958.1 hypothetical protein [Bacillus pumilus]